MTNGQQKQQFKIEEHIANLTSELSNAKAEMINMRIEKQELELRVQTAATLERKCKTSTLDDTRVHWWFDDSLKNHYYYKSLLFFFKEMRNTSKLLKRNSRN